MEVSVTTLLESSQPENIFYHNGKKFASELNIIMVLYVKAITEMEMLLIFSLLDHLGLLP